MMSSISVIDSKIKYKRSCMKHCAVSAFLLVTGAVYEMFSHGVYSPPMVFAFLYTLVGGGAVNFLMVKLKAPRPSRILYIHIYNCGLATLSVGSLFKGVLEIYGSGNRKVFLYDYVGWVMTAVGFALIVTDILKQRKATK